MDAFSASSYIVLRITFHHQQQHYQHKYQNPKMLFVTTADVIWHLVLSPIHTQTSVMLMVMNMKKKEPLWAPNPSPLLRVLANTSRHCVEGLSPRQSGGFIPLHLEPGYLYLYLYIYIYIYLFIYLSIYLSIYQSIINHQLVTITITTYSLLPHYHHWIIPIGLSKEVGKQYFHKRIRSS